ncbi:MAG: PAS domain S-box protein [Bacteriovorax sp.]|nr:PAS domain S-box protein [Bacteriovorax sp.]
MLNPKTGGFNETVKNLNALLQSMVEGMILQDKTGKIIQHNQAALEILGLTEDQLNDRDFIASQEIDLKEWNKNFPGKNHIGMDSLITGEVQRNIVLRIFRQDGEMRWISLNSVPILDNAKRPILLICTFTDITEMRRILNDLKQVQLLFNISHDLMIITNQEGYFKRINPRFVSVLGYTLNEIISEKFLDFVHKDDLDATKFEIQKLLEKKESIHFINRYKAKNNEYRVFDWVVVPDPETNLIYFTARDITDYRAEELDIIHSSKVYSIGELTSGLAYFLSGQLAIIGGHISFIQSRIARGELDLKDLKDKIKSIEESVLRLSKTTKELTSFARNIENERIINVSLSRILDNVLALCKERFRIHGVKLETKLDTNLVIHSRESQIAQVLICLLNIAYNAVHSQRDSWVVLEGTAINGVVRITITDSSPSTEAPDQKYFNVPKGIIEENFGNLYFDSTSPNTRFVIELPRVSIEVEGEV